MNIEEYRRRGNVKRPSTISEQLDKLRERGCIIEDEEHARSVLEAVNYFRLAHYFTPFLASDGQGDLNNTENNSPAEKSNAANRYRDGTTFEKVLRVYDFDRELRNILLVALEEIEVTMRAVCSNYHALKYGALGYKNPDSFDRSHKHAPFLNKIERMIDANTDSAIVSHHKGKYGGEFPLWVIMELFSFGMLTYFYKDMKLEDKRAVVSASFSHVPIASKHLDSWLDCLSDLRNHCAHYNRLYDNPFFLTPKATAEFETDNTLFSYIFIMKYLHKRQNIWNSVIISNLKQSIEEFSDVLDLSLLGFPADWERLLLW